MAKRKTPKKEKEALVDLAPKPEKITKSQLARLQGAIKTMDNVSGQLGDLELKKYNLLKASEEVQKTINELRKEFVEDYGTDNINIEHGTIGYTQGNIPQENPNPPEISNTKENGEADKED